MNAFLAQVKTVIANLSGHAWGTPAFAITVAIAAIILFFGAGTVARVIFGKDTGLFRTAAATLLVIAAALAAQAGALAGGAHPTLAAALAAIAALAAVWPAGRLLGVPYGQAFGIMLFALGITAGALRGAGYAYGALAKGAETLQDANR